jgi:predicted RNA-binding Zn ribbon-like protein
MYGVLLAKRARGRGRTGAVRGGRYRPFQSGRVQVRVAVRPVGVLGTGSAEIFARNMNEALDMADRIRAGDTMWRPSAEAYGAWRAANAVLRPTLMDGLLSRSGRFLAMETVRRFNRFATANAVRFGLTEPAAAPIIDNILQEVVHRLWELFESPARDRLKVCIPCGRWFTDFSRNRGRSFCSTQCHDRAWSRSRRRAARHSQYRRRERGGSR